MCGIVGIVSNKAVNQILYDSLIMLQHRGQDAAGIATCDQNKICIHKDIGLVINVFKQENIENLLGNYGIGHVRYPTAGCLTAAEAQPFYVNSPYGILLAHNGNLTNTNELREEIYKTDLRHINTTSDSEILLNVFANELSKCKKHKLLPEDIFNAVTQVYNRCEGGFSVISLIADHSIVCFRDSYGIRPACIGKKIKDDGFTEYMVASESIALNAQGFEFMRDIEPGEVVYITSDGQIFSRVCVKRERTYPCIFEYVYLSRPDSIIDGISVYKARLRMGEKLAHKIQKLGLAQDIDSVIPIPDTSRPIALQLAQTLGVKFREGFIKNSYIGRTFIMPNQEQRAKSVKQKLNTIDLEFRNKNVLLVDDSIVRGTTCKQIIQTVYAAGAKKVYFCSAAPPVKFPNVYGIDMPSSKDLIASNKTEVEIEEYIGVDWLIYQELDDLIDAVSRDGRYHRDFDCSVFDGKYKAGNISEQYLQALEKSRGNKSCN